jgi:hypothetical protein
MPPEDLDMDFQQQREVIKLDLLGKFLREDWHGVADCAMDLRELDAFQRGKNG